VGRRGNNVGTQLRGTVGQEFVRMCFALGLSENGCVETVFPANNPVPGAPEVRVRNPLCPTDSGSFWSRYLAADFKRNRGLPSDELVTTVEEIYRQWAKRFVKTSWIPPEEKLPYFVGQGQLTAHSGLVQIYHKAKADGDTHLLNLFEAMNLANRKVKQCILQYLTQKTKLNYFGLDNPPELTPFTPKTRFDKVIAARAAVASYIVAKLGDDGNLGRTKLAKVFYLLDKSENLDLEMNYLREAAGPFDFRAVYNERIGIESIAARSNFFYGRKIHGTRNSDQVKYLRGNNIAQGVIQASNLFGGRKREVDRLIELFRPLDASRSEVVATLYACWNDLLLNGKDPSDPNIINAFYSWSPSKKKYARSDLIKSLGWMRRKGIVPKGFGPIQNPPEERLIRRRHAQGITVTH
jgi:hypothetical protein